LVLLAMRLLLIALDRDARRERLYAEGTVATTTAPAIVPVLLAYGIAIVVALFLPLLAVAFFCAIAIGLVVPIDEVRRLASRRAS
jgi:hypothetical protein